ncbi:MAG: hypothetical protein AAF915_25665 [Cyanobacteria bacterium P01_D01_bin.50]
MKFIIPKQRSRDYANASKEEQKIFISSLKKELGSKEEKEKIVFFDEFAVYDLQFPQKNGAGLL